MEEYVRKMASIQEVNGVYPIKDADKICQYGILGWKVVDQVGKYQVGDKVVFCEIDCWIPSTVAPFLTKPGHYPKIYNGVEGEKLRTIRLRKALSQGLILPLSVCDNIETELMIGLDVSIPLGIQKWEPPAEFTSADAKGSFPSYIRKTDQARLQNVFSDIEQIAADYSFQVSEKLEGTSFTGYFYNGETGCCSRNLNLKPSDNTYWNIFNKYDLETKLRLLNRNIAIQGEIVGNGISGNIYQMTDHRLYVFDIFDIDAQEYLSPIETQKLIKELDLESVPVLDSAVNIDGVTLEQFLERADGKSVMGTVGCLREGLVYKANIDNNTRISFKTVSNAYLLGSKE